MNMDWFFKVYESIDEFAQDSDPSNAEYGPWAGGIRDMDHARELAREGWPEGVERARRMSLDMTDAVQSLGIEGMLPVEQYDVCGAAVDVGLFCEGEPECMVEYEEQVMPRSRVVRLVVQINFLAQIDAECAMRRGVALAAIVDALETTGLQCEVWAVDCTMPTEGYAQERKVAGLARGKGDEHLYRHAVLVKKAGEPMPLDRLAFAIGHTGFYRTLSFGVRGTIMGQHDGRSANLPKSVREAGELHIGVLTDSAQQRHFQNDEDACAWACEHFEKLISQAEEATS